MSNSSNTNNLINLLLGALFAGVTVGVILYYIDDMTIKSLDPTINDDDSITFRNIIESPNAEYLVSTQNEWKQDFYQRLNDYVTEQTDGYLAIESITISSGSAKIDCNCKPTKKFDQWASTAKVVGEAYRIWLNAIKESLDFARVELEILNKGKTAQKAGA